MALLSPYISGSTDKVSRSTTQRLATNTQQFSKGPIVSVHIRQHGQGIETHSTGPGYQDRYAHHPADCVRLKPDLLERFDKAAGFADGLVHGGDQFIGGLFNTDQLVAEGRDGQGIEIVF